MKFKAFDDFLNEADVVTPKKPAKFSVGDLVEPVGTYFRIINGYGRDKAYNGCGGMIIKITKVEPKSGKWFYEGTIEYGGYTRYSSGRSGYNSHLNISGTIGEFEKNFSSENVDKFLEIVKSPKFELKHQITIPQGVTVLPDKPRENDKVTKTTQSLTTTIRCIAVNQTIATGEVCYAVDAWGVSGRSIKESNIEQELEVDQSAKEIIAEEIANVLGVKMEPDNYHDDGNPNFKFFTTSLDEPIKGKMYFKDFESANAFLDDLKSLVEKHLDKNLIQFGKPTVKSKLTHQNEYDYTSVTNDKLLQLARNIGIDVKDFIKKSSAKAFAKKHNI